MTDAVAEKPETKRELILQPERCNLAEQRRQDWVVDAEEGTSIDDIMKPVYWSHLAQHFVPYDHVEVRLETGEWIAELIVTQVGRNWAQMFMANIHDLVGKKPETSGTSETHKVVYKGPHKKHCILRVVDGALIKEGISSSKDAHTELENYLRSIGT